MSFLEAGMAEDLDDRDLLDQYLLDIVMQLIRDLQPSKVL